MTNDTTSDQHEARREGIRQIIWERCQVRIAPADDDKNIQLDSMALLELIVGIENAFGIHLDESKLEHFYRFRSIESISELVAAWSPA